MTNERIRQAIVRAWHAEGLTYAQIAARRGHVEEELPDATIQELTVLLKRAAIDTWRVCPDLGSRGVADRRLKAFGEARPEQLEAVTIE